MNNIYVAYLRWVLKHILHIGCISKESQRRCGGKVCPVGAECAIIWQLLALSIRVHLMHYPSLLLRKRTCTLQMIAFALHVQVVNRLDEVYERRRVRRKAEVRAVVRMA